MTYIRFCKWMDDLFLIILTDEFRSGIRLPEARVWIFNCVFFCFRRNWCFITMMVVIRQLLLSVICARVICVNCWRWKIAWLKIWIGLLLNIGSTLVSVSSYFSPKTPPPGFDCHCCCIKTNVFTKLFIAFFYTFCRKHIIII